VTIFMTASTLAVSTVGGGDDGRSAGRAQALSTRKALTTANNRRKGMPDLDRAAAARTRVSAGMLDEV
jgi:hypothetical protein